jgi:hypothetical protein
MIMHGYGHSDTAPALETWSSHLEALIYSANSKKRFSAYAGPPLDAVQSRNRLRCEVRCHRQLMPLAMHDALNEDDAPIIRSQH